tara:strand:- start:226 stop:444 length:219 start_codon:yes stop_codon:yes gene_type:complete
MMTSVTAKTPTFPLGRASIFLDSESVGGVWWYIDSNGDNLLAASMPDFDFEIDGQSTIDAILEHANEHLSRG